MSEALFCDWGLKSGDFDQGSLFELPELTGYQQIFFDPLGFAAKNHLRQNLTELREAEYVSFNETELRNYLAKAKNAVEPLKEFLKAGGLWIIRANFPETHIQVRRRSAVTRGQFTESIISPFFWLEEFIGKHFFPAGIEHSMTFVDPGHPLAEQFEGVPIEGYRNLQSIGRGRADVLAHSTGMAKLPLLIRVSFPRQQGEIYFIPRFLIRDEHCRLVEAFSSILREREFGSFKPKWLGDFEKELEWVNPYTKELAEIDKETERLKRERSLAVANQAMARNLTGLLFRTGEELTRVVKEALRLLDFYHPEPPPTLKRANFDFVLKDKNVPRIVGLVASSPDGPIPLAEYDRLRQKIADCRLSEKPKVILVANAATDVHPEHRKKWFAEEILNENKTEEFCLLTTAQLFEIACYLLGRTDAEILARARSSLRKDLTECEDVFTINRRRYYGAVSGASRSAAR